MIRVYHLPVERLDDGDIMAGIQYVHDALIETTISPWIKRVIMDTDFAEHATLLIYAIDWNIPTPEELARFEALPLIPPPSVDYLRACEILHNPNLPINAVEIAELLRLFGRRLGYRFDSEPE